MRTLGSERLTAQPWFPAAPDRLASSVDPSTFDLPRPLEDRDLAGRWRLDFHLPLGIVPLAAGLVADIASGSQEAARRWPVAEAGGLTSRYVGPYPYVGAIRTAPPAPDVADAVARKVERYPDTFPALWRSYAKELESGLRELRSGSLVGLGLDGLSEFWVRARELHRRAWVIHFDVMYPILLSHRIYLEEGARAGVGPVQAAQLLGGQPTRVSKRDAAVRALARHAEAQGLEEVLLDLPPRAALETLESEPRARGWRRALAEFLAEHGERGGGLADLVTPSWSEQPWTLLGLVARLLGQPEGAPETAGPDPQLQLEELMAGLPAAESGRFRESWTRARQANAVWWNEDHNALIDLRAHLPIRYAALALARLVGAEPEDAVLFLFEDEVELLLGGQARWADVAPVAGARRTYVEQWHGRRSQLPHRIGEGAVLAEDPVVAEIFGDRDPGPSWEGAETRLCGLGVSPGIARGRARVVLTPDELPSVPPGSVLVCQATTPAWTTVFPSLAACVCDDGGMLTHAAIISRECGLPCVCGVGTGTEVIQDGDLVEVDGTAGVVTVLERATGR